MLQRRNQHIGLLGIIRCYIPVGGFEGEIIARASRQALNILACHIADIGSRRGTSRLRGRIRRAAGIVAIFQNVPFRARNGVPGHGGRAMGGAALRRNAVRRPVSSASAVALRHAPGIEDAEMAAMPHDIQPRGKRRLGLQSVEPVIAEGQAAVMHNGIEIIGAVINRFHLGKVAFVAPPNVLLVHDDIVVAVRTLMLVPHSQGMAGFVRDSHVAKPADNAHFLLAADHPHFGPIAGGFLDIDVIRLVGSRSKNHIADMRPLRSAADPTLAFRGIDGWLEFVIDDAIGPFAGQGEAGGEAVRPDAKAHVVDGDKVAPGGRRAQHGV
ncbi:MAG: hypothetical protein BWZ10_01817 [candidate division BRC1 bacterium ADurb.BinA364]|nr:MAG: hypothetical protein BWZ10_01817 [candidate division BRC1 bacterium ADurb.BinA364]